MTHKVFSNLLIHRNCTNHVGAPLFGLHVSGLSNKGLCVCVASARQSVVARQTFALVSKWPLTVFSKREQCPLLVLHQLGHQPDSRPDEQHPQCGVQQEVD